MYRKFIFTATTANSITDTTGTKNRYSCYVIDFSYIVQHSPTSSSTKKNRSVIRVYLFIKEIQLGDGTNRLTWWRFNCHNLLTTLTIRTPTASITTSKFSMNRHNFLEQVRSRRNKTLSMYLFLLVFDC